MAHSHAHGHDEAGWRVSAVTRRALRIALAVAGLATVVGLVALWPSGDADLDTTFLGTANLEDATVTDVSREPCSFGGADESFECDVISLEITSGPERGDEVTFELAPGPGVVELSDGDRIVVNVVDDVEGPGRYQFADFQRRTPLLWLAVLFGVFVIALGRLRGVMALVGLVISVLVLAVFVLPALLRGSDPLAVALVGSAVIAFVALYLAHGFNERTTVALLGTLASLLLTGLLGLVFVELSKFTGLASEEAGILQLTAGHIDVQGLLLAGIVIGSLGVLDDVTVTQVSAVSQLHTADRSAGARSLYRRALTIGRDHIASTVNTLVLAYAGASLPLLLLFTETGRPFGDVVNGEVVAVEVVRTLVGSIGLVASVPITTALAVAVVVRDSPTPSAPPAVEPPEPEPEPPTREARSVPPPDAEPKRSPTWEDFAPPDEASF